MKVYNNYRIVLVDNYSKERTFHVGGYNRDMLDTLRVLIQKYRTVEIRVFVKKGKGREREFNFSDNMLKTICDFANRVASVNVEPRETIRELVHLNNVCRRMGLNN